MDSDAKPALMASVRNYEDVPARTFIKLTFRVKLLMHIRVILLQPFLTFLRRPAEFAVLQKGSQILRRGIVDICSTSGGSVQTTYLPASVIL